MIEWLFNPDWWLKNCGSHYYEQWIIWHSNLYRQMNGICVCVNKSTNKIHNNDSIFFYFFLPINQLLVSPFKFAYIFEGHQSFCCFCCCCCCNDHVAFESSFTHMYSSFTKWITMKITTTTTNYSIHHSSVRKEKFPKWNMIINVGEKKKSWLKLAIFFRQRVVQKKIH